MCFPRLNKCFCCCSLRTGIYFICWAGLLWNVGCLLADDHTVPLILKFLSEEKELNFTTYDVAVFSQLYYATESIIMLFALLGVYSKRSCCLNLLVGSETIILLSYFLMTLVKVNRVIAHSRARDSMDQDTFEMVLILGAKYYLYLVIISFYYEVMHGRDGQTQGGWVFTQNTAFTAPPSAPSASELPIDAAQFVDTPYPLQPPYAPILAQPCPAMYPHHEQLIPQQFPAPKPPHCFAPPPYPLPQSHVINENPPPYAP